jgi:hypothetical protein
MKNGRKNRLPFIIHHSSFIIHLRSVLIDLHLWQEIFAIFQKSPPLELPLSLLPESLPLEESKSPPLELSAKPSPGVDGPESKLFEPPPPPELPELSLWPPPKKPEVDWSLR